MTTRFSGKTAIVTGAGSGIGRATAQRLAAEGTCVVATDVLPERLDELRVDLTMAWLVTVTGDISREQMPTVCTPPTARRWR